MSTFGNLNTSVTGLLAAQRAIAATGQNVVNANTPGYSRQRVDLAEVGPATTATLQSGHDSQLGGVRVQAVVRIKSAFIEATRAAAGARQNALDTQNTTVSAAQQLVSEPGEVGLQAGLDTFYNAWHDLSLNPSDGAAASVVIQQGQAVAAKLHMVADGLSAQWSSSRGNLANLVTQVNQTAADLAAVNGQLLQGAAGDQPNNELLDRRDTLVRSLGDLIGGVGRIDDKGMAVVSVGGLELVSGTSVQKFALAGGTDLSLAGTNPPSITWNGLDVPVESGQAAGYLAALRSNLPQLSSQLDGVAVALRDAVNAVHQNGFTLSGAAAGQFFDGTDARTLAVVPTQGSQLALTSAPNTVNGDIARQLGDLSDDSKNSAALGGGASAGQQWKNMVTQLGVTVQSLTRAKQAQDAVVTTADDAVTADSGVNIDEEMTNMLQFQRAYQASARCITTVDEMIDTLVNHTGIVGR
jgi:flagellar hook-associated protein 1